MPLLLRLNSIGRLPLPLTIMCVILHVMKLSQVLPFNVTMVDMNYISVLSTIGAALVGIGLMKLSSANRQSLPLVSIIIQQL